MLISSTDVGRTPFTPTEVYYPRGISSLSSRPMDAPVKGKGRRPAVDEEPEHDNPSQTEATLKPSSAKKMKLSKDSAESEESELLGGVVDGTMLPATEAEAIAAAEVSKTTDAFMTLRDIAKLRADYS